MLPHPDEYYFLLCCFAKAARKKMMQVEERHYYESVYCECVCVWVDVWPLSLASSPAPHVTHSLGPNVDQDRKTIKMMLLV